MASLICSGALAVAAIFAAHRVDIGNLPGPPGNCATDLAVIGGSLGTLVFLGAFGPFPHAATFVDTRFFESRPRSLNPLGFAILKNRET